MRSLGSMRPVHRMLVVALVFTITRLCVGYVAVHPDVYPAGSADASYETANYVVWANQMQDFGNWPYRDFEVEYPPGSIAVGNLPYVVTQDGYRTAFVVQAVAVDALGLLAICRLARRRGSWWGVGAWLLLLPLLGPVAYTRIDLVVACLLAWALERMEASRWTTASVLLALGVVVKLTPGLVLPAVVLAAPRRARVVAAAGAVLLVAMVPFVRDLGPMYDQVAGYHLDRGVHAESLWGSMAITARNVVDADVSLVGAFGASDVVWEHVEAVKVLSNLAALGVLVDSMLVAWRRVRRGDAAHLILLVCSTLTLLAAVGRVFSPQYLVWLVAPMAAALSVAPRPLRWSAGFLALSIALAHLVYPVLFYDYLAGAGWAVAAGLTRNLALLGSGLLAARVAWRWSATPIEDDEPERLASPTAPSPGTA
jgi:hypothetical protein